MNWRLRALIVLSLDQADMLTSAETLISTVAKNYTLVRDPTFDGIPADAIEIELSEMRREGIVTIQSYQNILKGHVALADMDKAVVNYSSSLVCLGPEYVSYALEESETLMEIGQDLDLEIRDAALHRSLPSRGHAKTIALDHNSLDVISIADELAHIEVVARESNEVGSALGDDREALLVNISTLRKLWSLQHLHVESFAEFAKSTLRWLASQAGSAVIGAAALALLSKILNYLG